MTQILHVFHRSWRSRGMMLLVTSGVWESYSTLCSQGNPNSLVYLNLKKTEHAGSDHLYPNFLLLRDSLRLLEIWLNQFRSNKQKTTNPGLCYLSWQPLIQDSFLERWEGQWTTDYFLSWGWVCGRVILIVLCTMPNLSGPALTI